jgi:Na+/proline symporter
MVWYWIVLIIIGYFIVAFLVALLFYQVFEKESNESALFGAFWPVFILVLLPIFTLEKILNRL